MEKSLKSKVFSAVAMLIIAVVALTSATYAWFSVTSNPSVGQIDLTVKANDGLMLSAKPTPNLDNSPDWKTNITQGEIGTLQTITWGNIALSDISTVPAQLKLGKLFDAELADSGLPKAYVELAPTAANVEYIKFTLWAKGLAGKTVSLIGDIGTNTLPAGAANSFVSSIDALNGTTIADTPKNFIGTTIRVGFVVNDAAKTTVIWEPNSTVHVSDTYRNQTEIENFDSAQNTVGATKAVNAAGALTNVEAQNSVDFIANGGLINLFTFDDTIEDATVMQQFDVYIWVEGADMDTINAVADSFFRTYLKFNVS